MAIDFTKPATSDLYATQFVPNIQGNQTALAQWLDSALVTITGTAPVGAKRFNVTSGRFERWSGSAWQVLVTDYLQKTGGDTVTAGNTPGIHFRSGNAAQYGALSVGRTATEGYVGISGSAGTFFAADAPGDMGIRAEGGVLRLGVGTAAQMAMSPTVGVVFAVGSYHRGAVGTPSGQSEVGVGTSSSFPFIRFSYAAGGTDSKNWDVYANGTTLSHRVVNDAYSSSAAWMEVIRSGLGISYVRFPAPTMVLNDSGLRVVNSASTMGAGLTANPTGGARLYADSNTVSFWGSGNTLELGRITDTGLGVGVTPSCRLDVFGNFALVRDGTFAGYFGRGSDLVLGAATSDLGIRSNNGSIRFSASGTGALHMVLDTAGRLVGAAWHNNAAGNTGPASPSVQSGYYTPTMANGSGVSGITARKAVWSRTGNVVTVSGAFTATLTSSATNNMTILVPVPTAFVNSYDASGVVVNAGNITGTVFGWATNTVIIAWNPGAGAASGEFRYTYQYEVI